MPPVTHGAVPPAQSFALLTDEERAAVERAEEPLARGLDVTDTDGIARVWAVIRPPDYSPGSPDNVRRSPPTAAGRA